MPSNIKICLNTGDATFDSSGIRPYFWPVCQEELNVLRDALIGFFHRFIRQARIANHNKSIITHICYVEIIREILILFRADKTLKTALEREITLEADSINYPYIFALMHGRNIDEIVENQLSYLWRGIEQPSRIIQYLRPIKFLMGKSGSFQRKTLNNITAQDTVCFAISPFIQRHAEQVYASTGRKVVMCAFWEAFNIRASNVPSFADSIRQFDEYEQNMIDGLLGVFKDFGYSPHPGVLSAIKTFSSSIHFYTEFYLQHLERASNKHRIPKTLWFGGTNSIYQRSLRYVVQNRGGHVVGHDHSSGFGVSFSTGELCTIFDFVDEFVTYSPFMARQMEFFNSEIMRYSLRDEPLKVSGIGGIFITQEDQNSYREKVTIHESSVHKKPHVMIVSATLLGELIAGLNLLPAGLTFLDFQIQLISYFKNAGYKVLVKAHPESRMSHPTALFDDDVELVTGYVEDRAHDVDLIVFDFLSSPFKTQIMSNIPMIYFDFGFVKMSPEMENAARKRLKIVKGKINSQNKIEIKWSDLDSALKDTNTLCDDETFLRDVYGASDNIKPLRIRKI